MLTQRFCKFLTEQQHRPGRLAGRGISDHDRLAMELTLDQIAMALQQELDQICGEAPRNTYLLYAMGLRLGTMDYHELAVNCIFDGSDDKKIDFLHTDPNTGVATIAQGYESADWDRKEAPANKASDLNTAVNWLLESDLPRLPRDDIRNAARELRDYLTTGEITRLELYYVHNLPGSAQVRSELGTVQRATQRLLDRYAGEAGITPDCLVREASREVVDEWRRSHHEAVSVHEDIRLTSSIVPQQLETAEWRAVTFTVSGSDLVNLNSKYGDALYSANVRDYLGSRESARNINRQIARTASEEPENFWVYNNGATLLTNSINVDGNDVELSGVSIINGAQTVGSLAEAAAKGNRLVDTRILVRAIKCNDRGLVDSVIRYNNTQNPIKAWELRVIDPIQRRLRDEFNQIGIMYQTRRGGGRRRASDVHYDKLGPYLSAFYGDPIASHKNKAELYENEKRYRLLFAEDTHVKNLLFIYRLGDSVALTKAHLKEKVADGAATDDEVRRYNYFRYGAFAFVVIFVCAKVLGLWLAPRDQRYLRRATLKDPLLFDQGKCEEFLAAKFAGSMIGPIDNYLRNKDAYQMLKVQLGVEELAGHVKTIVEQVHMMNPDTYQPITDQLDLAE